MQQESIQEIPESCDKGLASGLMETQEHNTQRLDQDVYEEAGNDLAHELRTTLAIITLLSGNLDLLYERLDDEQRRKMVRGIRKQAAKLNAFIEDVLELCNASGVVAM
jgi:signal transduction histidine kinase